MTTMRPVHSATDPATGGPAAGGDTFGALLTKSILSMIALCALAMIANLVVLSQLEHFSSQQGLRDRIRDELANGVAPVAALSPGGGVIADGSPIGILRIPDLDINEVVLFGTSSTVLMDGVGLRRDTSFPGQRGSSVLMGRAAAYGGPFAGIDQLAVGNTFTVVTGQGRQQFSVAAIRRPGDLLPPPSKSGSRLTLVTATGSAFLPSGVLRVDADLMGTAAPTAPAVPAASLRPGERALAGDDSGAGTLIFALQSLLIAAVIAVVARRRWGAMQAWVVCGPLVLVAGLWVARQASALLPNLM